MPEAEGAIRFTYHLEPVPGLPVADGTGGLLVNYLARGLAAGGKSPAAATERCP